MPQVTDITDLANATLAKYRKEMLAKAATTLQKHPAARRLLSKEGVILDGGDQYKWEILFEGDDNTSAVGLYEVDNLDQVNGTAEATIPWRYVQTGCHFDERLISANAGAARIFNFLKTKEEQMWTTFFEKIEEYVWDGNMTGTTDTKTPYGFFGYWFDYSGYSAGGFEGQNHANWTSGPAGVSCSTYARHKHYLDNYSAVSDADLVRKLRKAYAFCGFQGIPNKPVADISPEDRSYGIYTTYDVLSLLEELLDSKNDSTVTGAKAAELARIDGRTAFMRTEVEWVPYLQNNHATSDAVLGIDWNDVKIVANDGEWMKETPYHPAPWQHRVKQRFVDCSFNLAMHTRRKHFMLAKSDPMSD